MEKEEVKFDLDIFVLADRLDGEAVQIQVIRQEQIWGFWRP